MSPIPSFPRRREPKHRSEQFLKLAWVAASAAMRKGGVLLCQAFVVGIALAGAPVGSAHSAADDELPGLIAALDQHGISVLQESLAKPDTMLMTSVGSANYAVWSAFAARGWMIEGDGYGGGPVGVTLKTFSITPDGLAKIPAVLDAARKQ